MAYYMVSDVLSWYLLGWRWYTFYRICLDEVEKLHGICFHVPAVTEQSGLLFLGKTTCGFHMFLEVNKIT